MFDFLRRFFGLSGETDRKADFVRAATENEPERDAELAIIRACRDRFGQPPRGCNPEDRIALSPDLERAFVQTGDGLLRILKDQDRLLTGGQVCWGTLVQANRILFDPDNRFTCPANVVYSTDPFYDGRPSLLSALAQGLYAQKGSTPADREIRSFVAAVTNEMARVLRREMPHSYTGRRSVCFATCLIQPAHLPFGFLSQSLFPVVVRPEESPAMMLLPSRYWPPELVEQWRP